MVLLFLRDWRSALIVVITIPFALLSAVVCAVGGGPDHQHHDAGRPGARGRRAGGRGDGRDREHPHAPGARHVAGARRCSRRRRKTAVPRLLAMLCVLAVFVPSFFMVGVGRQLFVPLSLAVGFAMSRRTCCRARWCRCCRRGCCGRAHAEARILRAAAGRRIAVASKRCCALRWAVVGVYLAGARRVHCVAAAAARHRDLSARRTPGSSSAAARAHRHAHRAHRADRAEGAGRRSSRGRRRTTSRSPPASSACSRRAIRSTPSTCWTSGPHEAVLSVALKPDAPPVTARRCKERLRARSEAGVAGRRRSRSRPATSSAR